MRPNESNEVEATIDMAPLIDIVFILLIFFMVTTTFVKDMKLELERPKASSSSAASSKAIRLFIDRHGDTYLDGEPVRLWLIQSKLRDLLSTASSKVILVVTDEGVPAGKLIEVIDQARLSGAESVGVATKKEAG
ncbi:MAG: biopolymer transporter ExbD [Nitrosomonas sp.]|jgi:biopolymer transport protein ExbD|uniref:ExbD/TolR family protein n=1 Tax=Nitrosomonas sp. TaxID=42353 RepID=UPI00273157D7|nr:biopolymer transporter ExbD [Nitrosomonas sp.]MBK6959368.1 biopolymer transporter ExbD [Nitrosomonas sp.]MDP1548727.1 biopolymer transporter ExbD [Nitrosomonas sp.]MDP1933768.1 biopolymer transporter ExbD [Nitrosomonas sp.]MDP3662949.1 biopolymer transporter ExbD [Nitrosomonas sp.]MDZ4105484.1 biopolymer transporter ExbD [Nitrosomonas sp.]